MLKLNLLTMLNSQFDPVYTARGRRKSVLLQLFAFRPNLSHKLFLYWTPCSRSTYTNACL